jgi:hypothetical protein
MAAKKIVSKLDSLPKQTYFSKNSKGIVSGKSGGDYLIEKMGKKPIVKIDSTKKVMPGGGSKPSIIIKKETKIRRPLVGGSIPFPVRPEKKESLKKIMK